MDGISDNNNFGHVIEIQYLVDAASDSKEFCFSTCNVNYMVDHLYNWSVVHVCMWYQCSNIVLDACIWSYDGGERKWWWLQDHFIKLMGAIFIIFFFDADIERKTIWKIVNYSTFRRNSEWRGEKDGKLLLNLLVMSTKWPLMSDHCR